MPTIEKSCSVCDNIPNNGGARLRVRRYPPSRCATSKVEGSASLLLCLLHRLGLVGMLAGALLPLGLAEAAQAQGKLDARYTASLAGIPIGRGAWFIDVGDDKYLAAASGTTTGLMRLFSSGEGTGAARGSIVNGQLVPATYAASITTDHQTSEVRIALSGGDVKTFAVSPVGKNEDERVPLSEAHRHGVTDPMTGSIYRVAGGGDPLVPAACNRSIPVFDGRMRYNLRLAYKHMGTVKAAKGYAGPALVCAVYFDPIAGHIPGRAALKYLSHLRTMEVWLAPVAGTSVLVPFRFQIPTPIGLGLLEATQFVAVAQPSRPTPTSAKMR
jgi:hypothetical protein